MLQSMLLIAAVIGVFWGLSHMKRRPLAERRKLLLRSAIGALIILLIMLAITGRMHWLFALIGALIPFMRGLMGIGLQILPLWLKRKHTRPEENKAQQDTTRPNQTDMAIKEAMDTLGLKGNIELGEITAGTVNDAHRRLIQKLHPDRGGNDYLASKINQARDVLLKKVKE